MSFFGNHLIMFGLFLDELMGLSQYCWPTNIVRLCFWNWIAIAYGLGRGANDTHELSSCAAVIIRYSLWVATRTRGSQEEV